MKRLLNSQFDTLQDSQISVLVRSQEQAERLESHGVVAILFDGFDNTSAIIDAASNHDG